MSNPARDLLHSTPIKDIVQEQREVHTLSPTDNLWKAVKTLEENKIQSCPVINSEGGCDGFVDVMAITMYIVAVAPNPWDLANQPLEATQIAGRAISLVPVSRILEFSAREGTPVFETDPVSHAAQLFQSGTHHAMLFDGSKITNVCSQLDVVRFASARFPDAMNDLTVESCGFGSCEVYSVSDTSSVLTAMQKLSMIGIGAVAVVDKDGVLVGNFSASDLKGLYHEDTPQFTVTVRDHLAKFSERSLSPITIDPKQSLRSCMELFSEQGIHHAWVVDEAGRPSGLVSLTDIIKLLMTWEPHA